MNGIALAIAASTHPSSNIVTFPSLLWWSTVILAVFSSTRVLCGMWYVSSHDVSPWRQGTTPQLSCRHSPRFALTSKGPLIYMTEPPRFFSFQLNFTFIPWMFFLELDFKIFKWSNLLQNINVCPHWYDILLHLALYFYCISKIGVHPHGWDIHLLSK